MMQEALGARAIRFLKADEWLCIIWPPSENDDVQEFEWATPRIADCAPAASDDEDWKFFSKEWATWALGEAWFTG